MFRLLNKTIPLFDLVINGQGTSLTSSLAINQISLLKGCANYTLFCTLYATIYIDLQGGIKSMEKMSQI
jgi:hypothetical protein